MSTAAPPPETPRKHPDPEWWKRFPTTGPVTLTDLCGYCGHVRRLHDAAGCLSKSADLFTYSPCQCTNIGMGTLYHHLPLISP